MARKEFRFFSAKALLSKYAARRYTKIRIKDTNPLITKYKSSPKENTKSE